MHNILAHKLVIAAIAGGLTLVGVFVVVQNNNAATPSSVQPLFIQSGLVRQAEEYFRNDMREPQRYKDLSVTSIKEEAKTAVMRVEFSTAYECFVPTLSEYVKSSSTKYETSFPDGYIELSPEEINTLIGMGLVKEQQSLPVLYSHGTEYQDDWKRCYDILNYKKVGDSWEIDSSGDDYPQKIPWTHFYMPPKEQEKLGYKGIEINFKKYQPTPSPTPQPTQMVNSDGELLVDVEVEDQTYRLLVANTDAEQRKGLSNRRELNEADGMAFNFSPMQTVTFSNKDTYLNLIVYYMQGFNVVGKDYLHSVENGGYKEITSPVKVDAVVLIKH